MILDVFVCLTNLYCMILISVGRLLGQTPCLWLQGPTVVKLGSFQQDKELQRVRVAFGTLLKHWINVDQIVITHIVLSLMSGSLER